MEVVEGIKEKESKSRKIQKSRGELIVVVPFFIFSISILLASIGYKPEASLVPILSGSTGLILSGMRLIYLFYPQYGIGEFKQGGLAQEFDNIKEEIVEGLHLEIHDDEQADEISSHDEKKAFIYLIGCFAVFLLFGYLVGLFFVVLGCCYYYDYWDWMPSTISLVSMYLIVYLILYKLLGAPADFGLLLEPILRSYRII
jgi:hypothetical protein